MKGGIPKDEVLGGCDAEHLKDNNETSDAIVPTDLEKFKSTLTATLALNGIALFELADGGFVASKWNLTRHLPDPHAVAVWARRLGGAS